MLISTETTPKGRQVDIIERNHQSIVCYPNERAAYWEVPIKHQSLYAALRVMDSYIDADERGEFNEGDEMEYTRKVETVRAVRLLVENIDKIRDLLYAHNYTLNVRHEVTQDMGKTECLLYADAFFGGEQAIPDGYYVMLLQDGTIRTSSAADFVNIYEVSQCRS